MSRLLVCLALIAACAKQQEDATPVPAPSTKTATTAGTATATTPPPVEVKPAPDDATTTQCKQLLTRSWQAAQRGFAKLQVAVDAALEQTYTTDKDYLEACVALAVDKRDCLVKAENPIAGIDTCNVNQGAATSLALPRVESKIGLFALEPVPADEATTLQASLKGTWTNEFKAIKELTTWTIGDGGAVTSAEVLEDGKPKGRANVPDQLSFRETRRMATHWKDSTTTQMLAFYKPSKDVFYASTNSLYDVYPVANQKSFVVRHEWNVISYDGGTCEAINMDGLIVPATCQFARDGATKVFRATYQFPRSKAPTTSELVVLGDVFMHKAMFDIAKFTRRKPTTVSQ